MAVAAGTHLLPRTAAGWAALLERALRLRPDELRLPEHFFLNDVRSGHRFSHLEKKITPKRERQNAVLVLLSPSSGVPGGAFQEMCISLTKRTAKLRRHKNQMSFPGGRVDSGETPITAAQRETMEEVGIDASSYDVMGELHTIPGVDDSSIVPIVAVADSALEPRCNSPEEVASIHYVHLSRLLLDSEHTHCRLMKWRSAMFGLPAHFPCFFASASQAVPCGDVLSTQDVPSIPEDAGLFPMLPDDFPGELVWGLTAFIICELLARLSTILMQNHPQEV